MRRPVPTVAVAVLLLVLAVTLLDTRTNGENENVDPRTVEWVCTHAPDRVQLLFDSLSLDRPGLEAVKSAVAAKDLPAACNALIDYYRHANTATWLRHPLVAVTGTRDITADLLLADTLNVSRERTQIRRTGGGGIDWSYKGPHNDVEWGFALNALSHFNTLAQAYFKTGRREYVARVDAETRDWILANPHPGRLVRNGAWRGMTVAGRARTWMFTFYGLQECEEFSPAARILMLSSLVEHANYLMLFHRRDAINWTVVELQGLGTIGAAWPEFSSAPGWRRYSLEQMGEQMEQQVYPDGAQTELTMHYHRITTEQFDRFADVFRKFGHRVPAPLEEGIERMWSYAAFSMRPDGTTAENSDSERLDVRRKLLGAAADHDREDWKYIATNGAEGTAPGAGPSVMFPWAGQLVMRSGWEADAQWAFFDLGPYGTGHQHCDKLHLSVDAFGRALLVDSGRLTYSRSRWRTYVTGSSAHNVILIDGRGQNEEVERASKPVAATEYAITPEWDFARGVFSAGFDGVRGSAIHTRVVLFVKNEFWIVADRIETDRARSVEALWHFAPDCHVVVDGRDVVSDDAEKANLRISPVGGMRWTPAIVAGQESPEIQGWYSPYWEEKVPAPAAVFKAEIPGTATFAWVLLPARGEAAKVDARVISSRAERVELRVQTRPEEYFVVTIPMNAWKPTVRREK